MDVDQLIQQAIAAAQQGDRDKARLLLSQALSADPRNARVWYLLSQVVDQEDRVRYCLNKVLEIDPENAQAAKRLATLSELPELPVSKAAIKACPYCKSEIPANAIRCAHCGQEVQTAAVIGKSLTKLGCSLMWLVVSIPILILSVICLWSILTAK